MARWIAIGVAVISIAALVPAVIGLYIGWRAVDTARSLASSSSPSNTATPARLTPADLRNAPSGSHELDAALPAGGLGAVDAVTVLPWALTLAQAWSADARLERIDVTRMRPDGTVNAQDDPEGLIRYRFYSPGRLSALREQARLTTSANAVVELFVVLTNGKLQASVIERPRAGSATRVRRRIPPCCRLRSLSHCQPSRS